MMMMGAVVMLSVSTFAGPTVELSIPLWPKGAPGSEGKTGPEVPVTSDLQVDKSFAPTPNPTAGDLVTFT